LIEKDPSKPRRALQLIDELGLYSTIFTDPTAKDLPDPITEQWKSTYNCLHTMVTSEQRIYNVLVYRELDTRTELSKQQDDPTVLVWFLCAISPWALAPQPSRIVTKKLPSPYGAAVAREGLKLPTRVVNIIFEAFKNFQEITDVKMAIINKDDWVNKRGNMGLMIRRWNKSNDDTRYWKLQVLFAILVEALKSPHGSGTMIPIASKSYANDYAEGYTELLRGWQVFVDHLDGMKLLDVEAVAPLINGELLKKELGATPGKWMVLALDLCMGFQLNSPEVAEDEIRKGAMEGGRA
jgi:tRNA nucleotidyltransferase (CCA-adding enzyme)